jgi:hypothetical protein
MTVWAHRIIEIKRAKNPSFNFRDNQKFIQFLDEDGEFFSNVNSNGSGMVEVPIKKVVKAIKESKKLGLDEETIKRLHKDISFAKNRKNKYILYDWCQLSSPLPDHPLVTDPFGELLFIHVLQDSLGVFTAGLEHIPHFGQCDFPVFLDLGHYPGHHIVVG